MRLRGTILAAAIVLSPAAAEAAQPSLPPAGAGEPGAARLADALRDCHARMTDADRLACYDSVVGALPMAGGGEAAEGAGAWRVEKLGDAVTVGTSAFEVNSESRLFSGVPASLFIRCERGGTNVYAVFGTRVAGPGTQTVPVSVGLSGGSRTTQDWIPSQSGTSVGIWDSGQAAAFAGLLLQAGQLSLSVPVTGNAGIYAAFSLEGLRKAIEPVRQACRW